MGIASGAALLAGWRACRNRPGELRLQWPAYVVVALLCFSAFQLVPWPVGIAQVVFPTAATNALRTATAFALPKPSWLPPHIDPGEGYLHLLQGLIITATFLAAWTCARIGRRGAVIAAAAIVCAAVAVVGLLHEVLGLSAVYGAYTPDFAAPVLLGPLLNDNHLAGLVALSVPVAIGLAMDNPARRRRWAWLATSSLSAAVTLGVRSRSGVVGLAAGLITLAAFYVARRSRRAAQRRTAARNSTLVAALVAVTLGVGLGAYAVSDRLYQDLLGGDLSKLGLALEGVRLSLRHPLLGVGRGAFSAAFVPLVGGTHRYEHPESLLVQWTSEWGLVVGLTLACVVVLLCIRAALRSPRWSVAGSAAGLIGLGLHDMADYATEMAGVAVVASALLGAVVAPGREQDAGVPRHAPWHARLILALGLLALLAGGAHVLSGHRLGAKSQGARLAGLVGMSADAIPHIAQAARLHPSEPTFPLLAARHAIRTSAAGGVRYLNRAMELAPGWASPHAMAARLLAIRGRYQQALLELGEAESRARGAGGPLFCWLMRQSVSAEWILRAAPSARSIRNDFLDRAVQCVGRGTPLARALDSELMRAGVLDAQLREVRRRLSEADTDGAHRMIDRIRRRSDLSNDDRLRLSLERARLFMAEGHPTKASDTLDRISGATNDPGLLTSLAEAYAAAGKVELMRRTLEDLLGLAQGRPAYVANAHMLRGRLEDSLGNTPEAYRAYELADRLAPQSGALRSAARLAERQGDRTRAYQVYRTLCARGASGHEQACGRAQELVPGLPGS